ncbi:MAG: hypothetical protein AAF787_18375 [Chloroflexota bacterium]
MRTSLPPRPRWSRSSPAVASSKRNDFEKRKPNPRIRWDEDFYIFPYLVRAEPLPVPTPGGTDDPVSVLQVNTEWLSHVIGVLSVLEQRDSWTGTDAEIYAAQQAVEQIIASVQGVADFLENARELFRVKPGVPYILQRLNLDSGQYEDFFVLNDMADDSRNTVTIDTINTLTATGLTARNDSGNAVVEVKAGNAARVELFVNGVRRGRLQQVGNGNFQYVNYDTSGNLVAAPIAFNPAGDFVALDADALVTGDLNVTGSKHFLISHPLNDNKQLRYAAVEGPQAYVTHTGTTTLVSGTALVDLDSEFGLDNGTLVALVKTSAVRVWLQAGRGQWPTGNLVYDIVNGLLRIRDVTPPGVTVVTSNIEVHWQLTAVRDDAAIRASGATDAAGNLIPQIAKTRTPNAALADLRTAVDDLVADGQPRTVVERFILRELRGTRGWNDVGDVPQALQTQITAYLDSAYGVV